MGNFPVITPKELVKVLEKKGFITTRQKGSHLLMKKISNGFAERVTIPMHNKPLKRGTLLSILRATNLTKSDLR